MKKDIPIMGAVTWYYSESDNLVPLLAAKQEWYDMKVTQFFKGWYEQIFNLPTANNFGVAVWAAILGLPIGVFGELTSRPPFGFSKLNENFRDANFAEINPGALNLTHEEKIQVLRTVWYRYTLNGSVLAINRALKDVYGPKGGAYVIDHQNMTMEYVFKYPISKNLRDAFNRYGILPTVAGVKTFIRE